MELVSSTAASGQKSFVRMNYCMAVEESVEGGQENCQITTIGNLSNIHKVKLSNIHTVKLATFFPINSNHHGHTEKLSN